LKSVQLKRVLFAASHALGPKKSIGLAEKKLLKAVEGTCKEGFLEGSKWVSTHLKDAEELSFLSCCKTEKTVSSFICSHSPFTASLLLLLHL